MFISPTSTSALSFIIVFSTRGLRSSWFSVATSEQISLVSTRECYKIRFMYCDFDYYVDPLKECRLETVLMLECCCGCNACLVGKTNSNFATSAIYNGHEMVSTLI